MDAMWAWIGAEVVAVAAMTGDPEVKTFQTLQSVQLLEIPILLMDHSFHTWLAFYILNIPIEGLSLGTTGRYKWARGLMAVHTGLKIWQTRNMDCDWQFRLDVLYQAVQGLDKLIILALLAYTLPNAFRRVKEMFHGQRDLRKSRSADPGTPAPAPTA